MDENPLENVFSRQENKKQSNKSMSKIKQQELSFVESFFPLFLSLPRIH